MLSLHVLDVGPEVIEELQGLVERVQKQRSRNASGPCPASARLQSKVVVGQRASHWLLGLVLVQGRVAPDASRGGSLRERSRKPDVRRYLCSSGGRCRNPGRGCVRMELVLQEGIRAPGGRCHWHRRARGIPPAPPVGWYDGGCGARR